MLRFFRSSSSVVIIIVLLLGGLTWLHVLMRPEIQLENTYGAFLFHAATDWLKNMPVLAVWFGLLLTLLTAILLIVVNSKLHLIDKISYLPALCYVLLIGGVPMIHRFNPAVIAVILLIIGFIQLIGSFESERLSYRYFTAPIFIAVATFFYQYMYIYMLMIWFAILFLRPGYWREWVFSILGFLLPFFLAFSWFFLVEDDYTRMGTFFGEIFSIQRVIPYLSASTIAFFTISLIVIAITFGHLMRYIRSKKIVVRNGYYILILIAFITLVLSAMIPDMLPFVWFLMVFPLSFILSNYLATVKSIRWGTILLAFLFIGVIIAQIIYFEQAI